MSQNFELKEHTISAIREIADCLYQQRIQEGYQKLNAAIGLISDLLTKSYQANEDKQAAEEKQKEVLEILGRAMSSMEEKDTTLLADILQYELLELLETI